MRNWSMQFCGNRLSHVERCPSQIIIVVQSLCKDMNSSVDLYKGNSIRTLSKIVDGSMLGQIERYVRQAIVDPNPLVSSAALMCGLQLVHKAPDVVRRWASETQTAMGSKAGNMVQFHALALLHRLRANDPHAIVRLTSQLRKADVRSPMALCLLIRFTSRLLLSSDADKAEAYAFLDKCLRHKSDMVILEAARAMCFLPNATSSDLTPAITVLHMFIALPKSVVRFASVKTLNQLAHAHPLMVAKCNEELETLIQDNNRTIATLAITTLLKTGAASRVDALIRQVSKFMADIGDEFKTVVVKSVHDLVLRMPDKAALLFAFLSNALREEGGFEYKSAIIDVMVDCMDRVPGSTTDGLFQLCEFIEDCEFAQLAVKVCHLLGDKGPSQPNPAGFVRFIYNRVILEVAPIRAAAITALAKFAARVPSLRHSIVVLLQRSRNDDDDEVRDRAALYLSILSKLTDAEAAAGPTAASRSSTADELATVSRSLTTGTLPMSIGALQKALHMYQLRPSEGQLTFDALPAVGDAAGGSWGFQDAVEERSAPTAAAGAGGDAGAAGGASGAAGGHASASDGDGGNANAADTDGGAAALYSIEEFASFGGLFKSAAPLPLTESEQEYVVSVTKHMFGEHVVLDFAVKNTLAEVRLENLSVSLTPESQELLTVWQQVATVGASVATKGNTTHVYVALQRNTDAGYPSGTFNASLHFTAVDIDPESGEADGEGFPDEYPLEDVEITTADYVRAVPVSGFRAAWEAMGKEGEVMESFALPVPTVEAAATAVFAALGMAPCDNTGNVTPGADKHNAYLSGVFLGNLKLLARMQLSKTEGGTLLKMAVRSPDSQLSHFIMEAVA